MERLILNLKKVIKNTYNNRNTKEHLHNSNTPVVGNNYLIFKTTNKPTILLQTFSVQSRIYFCVRAQTDVVNIKLVFGDSF